MEKKTNFQERIPNSTFKFQLSPFQLTPFADVSSAKIAVYFTAYQHSPCHLYQALYFVNNSDETLKTVTVQNATSLFIDDELAVSGAKTHTYENVAPKEAVIIDDFDTIFDSDNNFYGDIQITKANNELKHFKYFSKDLPKPECFEWKE